MRQEPTHPPSSSALAAAATNSAYYARHGKVNPIAGGPGTANDNVYIGARSRPFDGGLSARPSDLLSVHLKGSVLIDRPGHFGHMSSLVPRDKAIQRIVWLQCNMPIEPGA